jgi:hypothetical protein
LAANVARAASDADNDSLPDWFEDREGFAWDVASASEDRDGDGFTDIEEYLHDLIAGLDAAAGKPTLEVEGTSDADFFTFDLSFALIARKISNFDPTQGDRIVLDGAFATVGTSSLDDFIEVSEIGGATVIAIDRDGPGTRFGKAFLAEIVGLRDAAAVRDSIIVLPGESDGPIALDGRDLFVAAGATGYADVITASAPSKTQWTEYIVACDSAADAGSGPDYGAYFF